MRRLSAVMLFCLAASVNAGTFSTGGPATTDNDASCDISLLPAATLLLPYFEVDIESAAGTGENTIFTITNTTQVPQVANVTLWTDWAYPVLNFNIFLTGYDMQSISLYDVIARGEIAPQYGTGLDVSPIGDYSGTDWRTPYDNALVNEESCVDLPVEIPAAYLARMKAAFTTGRVPALSHLLACDTAGGVHTNAVGYITIDAVNQCTTLTPADPSYYTDVILFDNVLVGDSMQINGNEDFAQGNALVHIRAIPEGGTARARMTSPDFRVNAPQTFYGRFQRSSSPRFDARQPLPSTFTAHWISGGATGYETFFKIWREARTSTAATCRQHLTLNAFMEMVELVRFDEEENPETIAPEEQICTPIEVDPTLPATALVHVDDSDVFPPNPEGAVAGWMYLNLDHCNQDTHGSQNWVVSSMRAEERFSVDIDATALGNGCGLGVSPSDERVNPIRPAPNVRP